MIMTIGVAVLLCYANQLTFFCGCVVLHSRVIRSSCRRRSLSEPGSTGTQGSDTPARYGGKSVAATRSVVTTLNVGVGAGGEGGTCSCPHPTPPHKKSGKKFSGKKLSCKIRAFFGQISSKVRGFC